MKEHDRGSSLIEVVIAVALMGIVVSGVLCHVVRHPNVVFLGRSSQS